MPSGPRLSALFANCISRPCKDLHGVLAWTAMVLGLMRHRPEACSCFHSPLQSLSVPSGCPIPSSCLSEPSWGLLSGQHPAPNLPTVSPLGTESQVVAFEMSGGVERKEGIREMSQQLEREPYGGIFYREFQVGDRADTSLASCGHAFLVCINEQALLGC